MCFVADFQVRLNGSSLSFAGTINVLYYGIWGGILGFYVDIRVGHVVCRQLGYSRAERIFRYASFGRVIGPLLIWRIQCNGNETEISQCKVETWNTSLHGSYDQRPRYAASLLCSKENSSLSKGKYGGQYLRKQPSPQPSNCPFKRGSKNNFIPRPKKGHFCMFLVISKIYILTELRWDLKSSGRIAQNITTDWLLQSKQRVMIFRLQEDGGRREGDIECPAMSLTTNHNSQVMKKYSWKRNQSGVGNITNISTLFFS